ncbi:MAG: hypothetical protein P9M08_12080, partial [Candidatus Erginobacter occultus]|nr:hypothetical protein [Candidatus Erginobacter occultus]
IMARVINTDSPGKRRRHLMRTVAELQRRLMKKTAPDDEVRDMLALAVFCLREIAATVSAAAEVWDERGYWKKAAAFENEWEWAAETAVRIETLLKGEKWEEIPVVLVLLAGKTSGIEVTKFTRKPELWKDCRLRLN